MQKQYVKNKPWFVAVVAARNKQLFLAIGLGSVIRPFPGNLKSIILL